MMMELLSLLFLLGKEAPVNKKPYIRGNAIEVLASYMNIKKPSSLQMLDSKFDEVCFKCLLFKSVCHDHCMASDQCIKEIHGYSRLFARMLHLNNFASYFRVTVFVSILLQFSIFQILAYQSQIQLECSGPLLRLLELHLKGLQQIFQQGHFGFVLLYIEEILLSQVLTHLFIQLYAVGRGTTLLELQKPYLYVHSRLDDIFEHRK